MKIFDRYIDFTDTLKEVCAQQHLLLQYKKLNNGYNFYFINANPDLQRSVCFSAGIHGDEIAGPYAVLKYLDEEDLPDINILFLPIVNPYGFDRDIRTNARRQDVNRRFCDKNLVGEAKVVYDLISRHGSGLFVSLHEWYGKDGYYMYASRKDKKDVIERIPKLASEYFKVMSNKINGEKIEEGVIWHPENGYSDERSKCTLENKIYSNNVHYMCIETPSQAGLERRVQCQLEIMKFILENLV